MEGDELASAPGAGSSNWWSSAWLLVFLTLWTSQHFPTSAELRAAAPYGKYYQRPWSPQRPCVPWLDDPSIPVSLCSGRPKVFFQLDPQGVFIGTGPHCHWLGWDEQKSCLIVEYLLPTTRLQTTVLQWTPELHNFQWNVELTYLPMSANTSRSWCNPSLLRFFGWLGYCEQLNIKSHFPVFTAWFPALLPQKRCYTGLQVWWRSDRKDTWTFALASSALVLDYETWCNWAASAWGDGKGMWLVPALVSF